jgi:peroxin-13
MSELQPRIRGWLLGSVDGTTKGFIPANHVELLGKRKGKRHSSNEPNVAPAQESAWISSASSLGSSQDLEASFAANNQSNDMFNQEQSASSILENFNVGTKAQDSNTPPIQDKGIN